MLAPAVAVAAPVAVAVHQVDATLVSAKLMTTMTRDEVREYLAGYGLTTAHNGVALYLITYRTVDVQGRPTTASALTVLPLTESRSVPTVAWLHGTRVYRGDTGSLEDNLDRAAAVHFAASGYATVAPDYLGLGLGTGAHPYMLAKPTVTATRDALRASRALAARQGKHLDRRVLVSGFSQGGQASLIVGRSLQSTGELKAMAAIAGPHDIRGEELPAALDGRLDGVSAVVYLGYAMTAWNRYYGLYDNPSEAFRAPYDQVVDDLFDSSHPESEVVPALPDTPQKLFTDDFLAILANPTGPLRRVLEQNDNPCDWRPTVPVRLYAGTADRDVVFANSQNCQDNLLANGARDTKLVNVGDVDHFGSATAALPQILRWFTTLR
jgi:pimeloyl-ACP methyl ester carboxylesterase